MTATKKNWSFGEKWYSPPLAAKKLQTDVSIGQGLYYVIFGIGLLLVVRHFKLQ